MKYLKLYEEFVEKSISNDVNSKDFILTPDIINNYTNDDCFLDSKGIIHIKNWKIY